MLRGDGLILIGGHVNVGDSYQTLAHLGQGWIRKQLI